MSFAVGVGGFLGGLNSGLELGRKFKALKQESDIANIAEQGLKAGEEARQKEIQGMISTQTSPVVTQQNQGQASGEVSALQGGFQMAGQPVAKPAEQGIMQQASPQPYAVGELAKAQSIPEKGILAGAGIPAQAVPNETEFMAGGQKFKTKDDAVNFASTRAASAYENFMKNDAGKIRDVYLKNGDLEGAERFQNFLDDKSTKDGQKKWMKGISLIELGMPREGLQSIIDAQNVAGYGSDVKISGFEDVTNDKGVKTGAIRIKFTGTDGVEGYRDIANIEDAAMMGAGLTGFQNAYKSYDERQKAAIAARLTAAKTKDEREFEIGKIEYKDKLDRRAKTQELGTRARLKVGDADSPYRKDVSPEGRRIAAVNSLTTNDETARKYNKATPAEREEMIRQRVAEMNGPAAPAGGIPLL